MTGTQGPGEFPRSHLGPTVPYHRYCTVMYRNFTVTVLSYTAIYTV